MRTHSLFSACYVVLFLTNAYSQKKTFNDAELQRGQLPAGLTRPMPKVLGWLDDNRVLLSAKPHPDSPFRAVVLDCKTGKESPGSEKMLGQAGRESSAVVMRDNDLYYRENDKPEIRLTNTPEKEFNPTLSPDKRYVAFTRNNDLYTIALDTKKENRLTRDGNELILNGYASWVYMEEILGRSSQYCAFWWSPDSRHIAYFRSDESKVPEFTMTDAPGLHGVVSSLRYPKVGDPNPEVKVGIVDLSTNATTWSDFNEKDDQYFGLPYWMPDGKSLLVQWMNRKQNELKIWQVNPSDGSKKLFLNETQKTWINLDDEGRRITFLANGKGFIYRSDASGYDHLYYYDMSGKLINAITSGNYTVTDVHRIDENRMDQSLAKSAGVISSTSIRTVAGRASGLSRLVRTLLNFTPRTWRA